MAGTPAKANAGFSVAASRAGNQWSRVNHAPAATSASTSAKSGNAICHRLGFLGTLRRSLLDGWNSALAGRLTLNC